MKVDIRLFIKDIPEGILKYCPEDLREHHLEHIWVPFSSREFLDMLLLYKDEQITEEVFIHMFNKDVNNREQGKPSYPVNSVKGPVNQAMTMHPIFGPLGPI